MLRYLTLTSELVKRDVRVRYRRTILGPLWTIIPPVMTMVVFTLLRGVVEISDEGVPYVIFSFAGLVPWTFFTNATTLCAFGVLANASLVKKMAVPREVFSLVGLCTALIDLSISGLILVAMMLWYKVPINWTLLWIPLLVVLTALLAWGVGMMISAVGVYKRDFIKGLPHLIQVWFYATPVVYPLSSVPEKHRALYTINPVVGLIDGFRSVLIFGESPDLGLLAISTGETVLILLVVWPFFRMMSQYFADVL